MAKAYSEDMRELVVRHAKDGEDKKEICKIFGIKINSIYKWMRQKKQSGNLSPQKRVNKPRKADYKQLLEIISVDPDITQKEIASMINMSQTGVCRALRRINICFKKKRYHIKRPMLDNKICLKKK